MKYELNSIVFIIIIIIFTIVIINQLFQANVYFELSNILSVFSNDEIIEIKNKLKITPFPNKIDFINYKNDTPPITIDIIYTYYGQTNNNNKRIRDNNELKYSLRSIYEYIPWINNIYLIVPDSLAINLQNNILYPSWLDYNKLNLYNIYFIKQTSIFHNITNAKNNHNSNAFEMNLHRIKGLSEYFIYFNDDFFIGRPITWKYFFILNNTKYIPRWPYNHYMMYYYLDNIEYNRNKHGHSNCYNYNVPQLKNKIIPQRVEYYKTHSPRALTKSLMNKFVDNMYIDYFLFLESHKERWCSSPTIFSEYFNIRFIAKMIYLTVLNKEYYKANDCYHEETFFLPLFKAYIDRNDIIIDVMDEPINDISNNYYRYGISIKEKCKQINKLKPYTFNINDDFHEYNTNLYNQQVYTLQTFLNQYFPNKAPWEK